MPPRCLVWVVTNAESPAIRPDLFPDSLRCLSRTLNNGRFLCSARGPFLRPGLINSERHAEPRSRMAAGHREAAQSVLDGGEDGVLLHRGGGCQPPSWESHLIVTTHTNTRGAQK